MHLRSGRVVRRARRSEILLMNTAQYLIEKFLKLHNPNNFKNDRIYLQTLSQLTDVFENLLTLNLDFILKLRPYLILELDRYNFLEKNYNVYLC